MGYRELLKRYIRHLELVAGDNFIEVDTPEPVLSKRDLGELLALSREINRDAYAAHDTRRIRNYNYRLRLMMNRWALTSEQASQFAGTDVSHVRRWRTSPKSPRYQPMSAEEYDRFEKALLDWLENEA